MNNERVLEFWNGLASGDLEYTADEANDFLASLEALAKDGYHVKRIQDGTYILSRRNLKQAEVLKFFLTDLSVLLFSPKHQKSRA